MFAHRQVQASFIILIFSAIFLFLDAAPLSCEPAPLESTKIFVVTDIHYLAEGLHDDGKAFTRLNLEGDGKNTDLIRDILEALYRSIQKEKPEILLVTGDLTLNGEKKSHTELAAWFSAVEALGTEVLVLPGNHDILNPWARGFSGDRQYTTESVTPEEFKAVYRNAGFAEALSRDTDSLSYVVEPVPGLRVFMLDSARYADNIELGNPGMGGGFSAGTLEWIGRNADAAGSAGAQTVVAMHHSLVDHNPFVSEGYTVADAPAVLGSLAESGFRFILTGHVHVQDISMTTTSKGLFYDIATNALSVYPHTVGALEYIPRERKFSYTASPVDVEAWAREKKKNDPRLLDFDAYAERFFKDRSRRMVERMLARREEPLSKKREGEIQGIFEILNSRFFSGTAFMNMGDIIASPGYLDLVANDYGFLSDYGRSIIQDPSPENRMLDIAY